MNMKEILRYIIEYTNTIQIDVVYDTSPPYD